MKTIFSRRLAIVALACCTAIACKDEVKDDTAMAEEIPGINLENMDKDVSPKDDFYNYVNGSWMKTTQIPDDETRWGGFGVLRKSTRNDVLEILNTSKELGTYKEGTDQKKALLIFESELDTVARNEAGVKPIMPYIDEIKSIKSIAIAFPICDRSLYSSPHLRSYQDF